jgi:hypothetical protein
MIFVDKLNDIPGAEKYCETNYKRTDTKSDNLFTLLYSIYLQKGLFDKQKDLSYINKNGFRMDAAIVFIINIAN